MGICNTSAKQDLGGPDESSKNEDYDLDCEVVKNTAVVYFEAECKKYLKSLDLLKSINVKPTVHCITQSNQAKALKKSLKKLTGNSSSPYIFITGKYYGSVNDLEAGVKNHTVQKIINSKLESIGSRLS